MPVSPVQRSPIISPGHGDIGKLQEDFLQILSHLSRAESDDLFRQLEQRPGRVHLKDAIQMARKTER